MKLNELQNKLEDLQSDLLIIYETTNAIENSIDAGLLSEKQVIWALMGTVRSADKAVQDVQFLIDETIQLRKKVEQI